MQVALLAFASNAQTAYVLNGSAIQTDIYCVQLTDISGQAGSAWCAEEIDLSMESFDFTFTVNLGAFESGADGIVFTLQNSFYNVGALGGGGGGMGYAGIAPSVGIELDTYNNGYGDLPEDHIGLNVAGSTWSFVKVPAKSGSENIEDGFDHTLRIVYKAATQKIAVYFDGQARFVTKLALNNYFPWNKKVYWGFTGGTGASSNIQYFCEQDLVKKLKSDAEQLLADESLLEIFPNPAFGKVNIKATGLTDSEVRINLTDAAGRIVFSQTAQSSGGLVEQLIDVSGITPGIYYLNLLSREINRVEQLFVIR